MRLQVHLLINCTIHGQSPSDIDVNGRIALRATVCWKGCEVACDTPLIRSFSTYSLTSCVLVSRLITAFVWFCCVTDVCLSSCQSGILLSSCWRSLRKFENLKRLYYGKHSRDKLSSFSDWFTTQEYVLLTRFTNKLHHIRSWNSRKIESRPRDRRLSGTTSYSQNDLQNFVN